MFLLSYSSGVRLESRRHIRKKHMQQYIILTCTGLFPFNFDFSSLALRTTVTVDFFWPAKAPIKLGDFSCVIPNLFLFGFVFRWRRPKKSEKSNLISSILEATTTFFRLRIASPCKNEFFSFSVSFKKSIIFVEILPERLVDRPAVSLTILSWSGKGQFVEQKSPHLWQSRCQKKCGKVFEPWYHLTPHE